MRAAIASPERHALEPEVDGVLGLIAFDGDRIEVRGRKNLLRRSWLSSRAFRRDLDAFAERIPALRNGSVLDGELFAGSFHRTMALLQGRRPFETGLRLVVFDLPTFAGVDPSHEPWETRRERLERLAIAFTPSLVLSLLVEPTVALGESILAGELEGIVLKDRTAPYRSGSRRGWSKLKAPTGMRSTASGSDVDAARIIALAPETHTRRAERMLRHEVER